MALRPVSIDDKYCLESGDIFLTGIQALVRLPLLQRRRDLVAGLNTAGYISGYRGSPLAGLDQQLWRAQSLLDSHHIKFLPAVNEDLAATSCWGTQQAELDGSGRYDGVFAMWYGKGPGVDRSGDALRHGNLAGSSKHGGVLVLVGDDHACESSTTAHQSEYALVDAMIPILNPAGITDILDFGLLGWAMSRFTGCWVGLKCVHDTVESSASIRVAAPPPSIALPESFEFPDGGLNIRWPDTPQQQEVRLHEHKQRAVLAFCEANRLNRIIWDSRTARFGIVTTGKSYLDVRQALAALNIDAIKAQRLGLRLLKIGMPWPLEKRVLEHFATGLETIVVVEEKRGLIEEQLKALLYGGANTPTIIGKHNERGEQLFASAGRLGATEIAIAIGQRVFRYAPDEELKQGLAEAERAAHAALQAKPPAMLRTPYFCAGCPHNSSTKVPQGSRALAGIGCHYMVQWMERDTQRYTQMGAEGASWIGESLFSTRSHMFQNIGDGTYFHSGLLAIRAAIAAGTHITYKILFNDAVAMTGGQAVDGPLNVPQISRQLAAEGVTQIVVVSDEPEKYSPAAHWAAGVRFKHRRELDLIQRELREMPGTTVIIYDQTCAAEKRRRRKRNTYPDPPRRVFINSAVCEGCGDCGLQSNCVALVPLETEFGRKRAIDQSACNKDFSCVEGFCPSFVSVLGAKIRKPEPLQLDALNMSNLPDPQLPQVSPHYAVVLTGIGGTGVVTMGAILGMAAHLDHLGCSVLDMMGLAQKGGAVVSHIVFAPNQQTVLATHVSAGAARLLLAADLVTAAHPQVLATLNSQVTQAVINTHAVMTGEFVRDRDREFPAVALQAQITERLSANGLHTVSAHRLAETLLGDAIGANLLMIGYAYQLGLLPISAAAIQGAIALNGVAVEMNQQSFMLGRYLAFDSSAVMQSVPSLPVVTSQNAATDLDTLIADRSRRLARYQNAEYARDYRESIARVSVVDADPEQRLSHCYARNLYKLMAYKDEYEVARLYTDGNFQQQLAQQFQGDYQLVFHLAVPWVSRFDRSTGRPIKRSYGAWVMVLFRLLAKWRRFRGTWADPLRFRTERVLERKLIVEYKLTIQQWLTKLNLQNYETILELAKLPENVRGFGPVKAQAVDEMRLDQQRILQRLTQEPKTTTDNANTTQHSLAK